MDIKMNTNIIDYLKKEKGYKQKDIAENVGVSGALITEWKLGKIIAPKRDIQLRKLAELWWEDGYAYDGHPRWSVLVKSRENEQSWFEYFENVVNELPDSYLDTGSIKKILLTLNNAGITINESAPGKWSDELEEAECEAITIDSQLELEEAARFYYFIKSYIQLLFKYREWCNIHRYDIPSIGEFEYMMLDYIIYKLMSDDDIIFPDRDEVNLSQHRRDTEHNFNEIVLSSMDTKTGELYFDVPLFKNMIKTPETPPRSEEFLDHILNSDKLENDNEDFFNNNLKTITTNSIEQVIAKALSDKVGIEYKVNISGIEYLDTFSFNKAKITIIVDKKSRA
jgi:transcriptional regulator with XRE-family HTH domain